MIIRYIVSNFAKSLRLYAPGMQRAEMKIIASDYSQAADYIEELQALCDEKDATIEELCAQMVKEGHAKAYGQSFEQDGEVIAFGESFPYARIIKKDSVSYGPVTRNEALTVMSECKIALCIEDMQDILQKFALKRGLM